MARKSGIEALLELPAEVAREIEAALQPGRLDLALAGRPAAALQERVARLKGRIAALEAERADIIARIDSEIAEARAELGQTEKAVTQARAETGPALAADGVTASGASLATRPARKASTLRAGTGPGTAAKPGPRKKG